MALTSVQLQLNQIVALEAVCWKVVVWGPSQAQQVVVEGLLYQGQVVVLEDPLHQEAEEQQVVEEGPLYLAKEEEEGPLYLVEEGEEEPFVQEGEEGEQEVVEGSLWQATVEVEPLHQGVVGVGVEENAASH